MSDNIDQNAKPVGPRNRKRLYLLVATIALVTVVLVLVMSAGGSTPQSQPAGPSATTDVQSIDALLAGIPQSGNALGSPTAPVTLQFFGDLECPTSREFTVGALPSLIDRWVRGGKLRIEYRSLETATREPEVFTTQQVAALAAGMQDKLWYYAELFYHEQGHEDSGYVDEGYLQSLAHQTQGLNITLWGEDRKDPQLQLQVEGDGRAATGKDFHSTPSFLIGHTGSGRTSKVLNFSVIESAAFNQEISRLLAEAPVLRARTSFTPATAADSKGPQRAVVDWTGGASGAGKDDASC